MLAGTGHSQLSPGADGLWDRSISGCPMDHRGGSQLDHLPAGNSTGVPTAFISAQILWPQILLGNSPKSLWQLHGEKSHVCL